MRMLTQDGHRLVYHYTNADGLIGIVNSKQLWATKIQYLDDKSELIHAFSVTESIIHRIKRETNNDHIKKLLERIPADFERVEHVNVFVFSFSYVPDLLSQWRAYCPDGGYALGFDPRVLEKLAAGQGFKFVKCVYNEKEQKSIVEHILKDYLSSFQEKLKTAKNEEEKDRLIKDSSLQAVEILTSVSPKFKHPSFMEEQEFRLVSELKASTEKAINCRNKQNLVIPYYEFALENDEIQFKVEQIVIGPGLPIELTMDSVSILFNRNQRKFGSISHTSIPYKKSDQNQFSRLIVKSDS